MGLCDFNAIDEPPQSPQDFKISSRFDLDEKIGLLGSFCENCINDDDDSIYLTGF